MQEARELRERHQMAVSGFPKGGVEAWTVIGPRSRPELWRMVEENAVVVFSRRGCCMSHVVKRLLQVVGANPAFYEVEENDVADLAGQFPAVFIGGRWFGGLERIIATHIKEELTPLLKQAGALWL